ncbi:hypothetical protein C8J57DRAFT_1512105 [Mycena rebaudengoi]|nr:hypothetical protein C8J57DRAFT_1512105 [Mycena rebaudengoi]
MHTDGADARPPPSSSSLLVAAATHMRVQVQAAGVAAGGGQRQVQGRQTYMTHPAVSARLDM